MARWRSGRRFGCISVPCRLLALALIAAAQPAAGLRGDPDPSFGGGGVVAAVPGGGAFATDIVVGA